MQSTPQRRFRARGTSMLAPTPTTSRPPGHRSSTASPRVPARRFRLAAVLLAAAVGTLLAACGSSKPAYCSDRSNLEKSVKEIPSLASSGNLSGLRTQATKIQGDATTLANSAKTDFPTETSALTRDIDALVSTVKDLPASPQAQDYAKVAINAATAVSAVSNFSNATNSKCS